MTLTHWLLLLFGIGVGYSVWHLWVAMIGLRVRELSGENGMLEHIAVGDLRRSVADLVIALLLLAIVALPSLVPLIGLDLFRLLQQSAFLLLGSVFVVGMAFARLHERSRPR